MVIGMNIWMTICLVSLALNVLFLLILQINPRD
jgi:hypothetical protein